MKILLVNILMALIACLQPQSLMGAEIRESYGGITRSYILRAPDFWHGNRNGQPHTLLPLVIVLHGNGQNAAIIEKITGFTEKAMKEHFFVVYPNGFERSWNAKHCCGGAMRKNVDDVSFIGAIIDNMIRKYPVDPDRVYVTGMSNGGMMTHILGASIPQKITAIAPVMGALFGDEKPTPYPMPVMMVNGLKDDVLPIRGGQIRRVPSHDRDGMPIAPSTHQSSFWLAANNCDGAFKDEVKSKEVNLRTYSCPVDYPIQHYFFTNIGHMWPRKIPLGIHKSDGSFDATDEIWDFLGKKSKK